MRKEQMIELMKEELQEVVSSIRVENLSVVTATLVSQIELLQALEKGIFISKKNEGATVQIPDVEGIEPLENLGNLTAMPEVTEEKEYPIETFKEEILDGGHVIYGLFKRKLRGGVVHTEM